MSDSRGPQYLNADGSFTRKRPGPPKTYNSAARSLAKRMEDNIPKKVDPATAEMLAKTLKAFLRES